MSNTILAGRYHLHNFVGEGSYSSVYRGWDTEGNRIVAAKKLKVGELEEEEAEEARALFFREIEFLKSLDHPSIPKYYDFIFENGNYYLIMEWVEGDDLMWVLKQKGKVSQAEAMLYMDRIADVLQYMQNREEKVIYKDLKPLNIMVDKRGNIKIIDFGTARIFSASKKADTHALGTPGYAPPEAYQKNAQTDLSADIYSLGATVYHLVTGEEPCQFKFQFPDPRKFDPKLSASFAALILDCLKPP